MKFTAKKTIKTAIAGGALAATALLSACGGNNVAGNGSPVKNAAVDQAQTGGGQGAAAGGSDAEPSGGDVNCSKHGGQVGAPGRPKRDLIAVAATDGTTPGCTEAYNVITEYYEKLPQAEGPGERVLDVRGKWTCARLTETGTEVVCGVPNSSLQLETRPSGAGKAPVERNREFPNTTQRVRFTGYDADLRMLRFQLMTDGKTYRLPLEPDAEVFSAATLCPGESVTVDDEGHGDLPCGKDQLIRQVRGGNPVLARISVNGDDQIATVKEIYRP
ncbi:MULTISPECIES: hypothetical protein [Amycolatopsis]|uniref:hypothetical protein n=1 Tax=Amycolatopsis TaxID=1813 RepID=UPI001C588E9A|nr:hypothetical protein [Amycolatopsis sp. TNS106]QXV59306.1 hypothetical protein CVV72_21405 [Amycolatopsis sp. TNS106]